ncbi:MAG: amino acid racemase [Mucilaginibacter sp.]|nr:amino acid racemase [Mucilaginibacter sp.]
MHKKIGIIGGLSPESTVTYYLNITRKYIERFGDCSYPEIVIYSVNLENYHTWRQDNRWDLITDDLVLIAEKLRVAGADFGLIATNTMHKVFKEVQSKCSLPLLHILDPTINAIINAGVKKVGLLGTRFTMSETFYRDELAESQLESLVPDTEQQEIIHRIIEQELVRGILTNESRQQYLVIINDLITKGAEAVILGCTEIPLLISQSDCCVPVFDTAILHSDAALGLAVSKR